jgi:hypothetical protein
MTCCSIYAIKHIHEPGEPGKKKRANQVTTDGALHSCSKPEAKQ